MQAEPFTTAPFVVGKSTPVDDRIPIEETLCPVISHEWVNAEYKHLVVDASPKALAVRPGQFFNLLCPAPDQGELWLRRPQSVYRIDRAKGRIEFLYKCVGRATMGPISQLAGENGVKVTAILSARSRDFALGADLFAKVGDVIPVLDSDGSSAVENVEAILNRLIAEERADAFYTCGSNRLMQLMKQLGKQHGIPGQVAMEQVMACGLGPCYVCVRTFDVDGKKELRRVCIDGPVFDLQEALGW